MGAGLGRGWGGVGVGWGAQGQLLDCRSLQGDERSRPRGAASAGGQRDHIGRAHRGPGPPSRPVRGHGGRRQPGPTRGRRPHAARTRRPARTRGHHRRRGTHPCRRRHRRPVRGRGRPARRLRHRPDPRAARRPAGPAAWSSPRTTTRTACARRSAPESGRYLVSAAAAGAGARPAGDRGDGVDNLSAREIQVLQLVADGKSNKDIGDELGLSALTVKSHLARIARKLGTGDRAEMVATALRSGRSPDRSEPDTGTCRLIRANLRHALRQACDRLATVVDVHGAGGDHDEEDIVPGDPPVTTPATTPESSRPDRAR